MESIIETTLVNISVLDLTKDELLDEYNSLKKRHEETLQDVEQKNQQIYDYKRQIAHLSTLEREYLQEIEIFQLQHASASKKTADLVQSYEEQIKSLKEDVQRLEDESNDKSIQLDKLHDKAKTVAYTAPVKNNEDELEKLREANFKLKDELSEILLHLEEMEVSYTELQVQKANVESQLNNMKEDNEQLQMNYTLKRDEINEKNILLENLQDEMFVVKNELDQLKTKPQDQDTRGNSLFAEVNDRRIHLTKEIKFMQTKYREMKAEREKMLRELSYLQKENMNLQEKYKADVIAKADCINQIEAAYKSRVSTLEQLVESYNNDFHHKAIQLSGSNLIDMEIKFLEGMLKQRSTEINELREKLNKFSLSDVVSRYQLRDCKAEVRNWKSQATDYKQQLEELKLSGEMKKNEQVENAHKVTNRSKQIAFLSKVAEKNRKKCYEEETATRETEAEPEKIEIAANVDVLFPKENCLNIQEIPDAEEIKETGTEKTLAVFEKVPKKVTFTCKTPEKENVIQRTRGKILTCKTLFVPKKA